MKKISALTLFSLCLVFLLALVFPIWLNAEDKEFYFIYTSPGADMATEMRVSWHSDVDGTFVEYAPAAQNGWENAVRVDGECTPFSMEEEFTERGKLFHTKGFTERNVCKASLTGLTPNTEYKYRVGKTTFSEPSYFKTGGNVEPFSFLFLTDPQFFSDSTAKIFNNLVYKAMEMDPDIRYSIVTGDMVDRAGDMNYWGWLFNQPVLKEMPFAWAAGNHEYYDSSGTVYGPTFLKTFTNFPDNGAPTVLGTSYYFKYNNVLSVVIDSEAETVNSVHRQEQMDWFEEVMRTNHAQYITVYMHTGIGMPPSRTGAKARWLELFDKYGVDIVMTGHSHVYFRTKPIYDFSPSTDPDKGTIYLEGGYSGPKAGTTGGMNATWFEAKFATEPTVTIFQVTSSQLYMRTVNINGFYLDEATIPAKRSPLPATGFEKESYLNSITLTLDEKDPTKAIFYWGNKWYGHVNSVKLTTDEGETIGHDYLYSNRLGNYMTITGLEPNQNYKYTLTVDFKDGTTAEREITLQTPKPSYGRIDNVELDTSGEEPTLTWFALLQNNRIKKYRVLVNGELFIELDPDATECPISDLNPYRLNEITLEAIDVDDDVVFTDTVEYGEDVEFTLAYPSNKLELKPGDTNTPTVTVTPNLEVTIIYESSNEAVATVDANGKITAVAAGEATITAKLAGQPDVSASITVTVKVEETPEPEPKKKGCFGGITAVFGLSALGLVVLYRRRRRHQ
jgi:hypothetical protein